MKQLTEIAHERLQEIGRPMKKKKFRPYYKQMMKKYRQIGDKPVYKIFGYGSLMNERSRQRTMEPFSVKYGKVEGYKRIFNLKISNGTCLNIKPSEESVIDGVICAIDPDDMYWFIQREFQYDIKTTKTTDGEEVYIVMATGDNTVPEKKSKDSVQQSLPRLDYIQACFHGITKIKEDNLFFTKDTVMADNTPLVELMHEISPMKKNEEGEMQCNLIDYFKYIDSNY